LLYTLSLHDALPISRPTPGTPLANVVQHSPSCCRYTPAPECDPKRARRIFRGRTGHHMAHQRRAWQSYVPTTPVDAGVQASWFRSEEHTSELQSLAY